MCQLHESNVCCKLNRSKASQSTLITLGITFHFKGQSLEVFELKYKKSLTFGMLDSIPFITDALYEIDLIVSVCSKNTISNDACVCSKAAINYYIFLGFESVMLL